MITQFACSVIPSADRMPPVASRSGILPSRILAMVMFILPAMAAPPDLTNGGVPSDTNNINLGPTGMRGWVYRPVNRADTSEARQILVTSVAAGSPANGILAVNDVILGVDGTGATPGAFASDARVTLGLALGDAEARNPATLKLLRWRAGVTETVDITLQTLGAYSATAPYNCPKSAAILEQGLAHRTASVNAGQFGFGTLALLAGNDPSNPANAARQALAQAEARGMIATQAQIDFWKSGQIDTNSKVTWSLGHKLVVLSEYYLQTWDPLVLPTIEAMAVQVANGQSHLGTMGHQLTNLNAQGAPNDAYNVGYGTINSAGMPTFLGLLLAKECGLTNPQIDPAIQRASRFYAAYTGYGAHPYGEHEPYRQSHESNGKSGLSALCFELLADRAEDGKFYSMMATAASSEREEGHTGSYFNQLWAPLGAATGGEEAVATYFSRIRWMLDLNREWDGGFYWNRLEGSGSGERWNDFDMSTAALLTYALPLRKLHITGRAHDPARYFTSQEVADAIAAEDYDATTRTTSQLVTDLGNWSPKVQYEAANEIGLRTAEHATLVPQLIAIANDTQAGESRVGACFALGEIGNGSAAAAGDLAALLDDADDEVRFASAEALRYLPQANKLAQLNTILTAAASTGKPFFPIDEEDPMHFAHARLSMLLFYGGTAYGPKGVISGSGINGVDRTLLYPAIEAVAATPFGQARSTLQTTYTNLTHDDVLALSGTILDSIVVRAPADKMFSGSVRTGGVQAMEKYNIADGVTACMKLIEDVASDENLQLLGSFGAGVYTVEPDPDAVGFLQSYLVTNPTGAREALSAIATDINPLPLTALKTVQLTTADDPILDLPATSTVLRVNAFDHAQGDSIYTWNKVFGPGAVTFTPNGTAAAANCTVQFDGTPGAYEFEVTMSDSRGLTESYGTVVVLVSDGSAADTTAPPAPGFATAPTGTSISSITMTAQAVTDPEGNGTKYYFTCTSGGGNDSGWQTSPTYTDTGLLPDTTYAYTVTVRDLSVNQNTSAASPPAAGSTLGLPTSTLSNGVFHILGSSQTPTSNVIHNVSVNGAYAGFKGQGNVGTGTVLVDQTFNGTIVDYAFVKESATPDVIETYSNGGAGRLTFGSYLPRAGSTLANNSDMKLWTVNDPGSPAYSNPANFTSNTSVGAFDNINGSIDISGITVGSVYFFYSGYRSMPFFSATMKDTEALVADVPLPVFGDGDTANSTEHYVCSLNFVNNNGLDTIDWSLTSSLYNGEPLCSLRGIVLVTSTGQIAMIPNVVGLTQTAAQNSIKSAGFSVGSVLLRSSATVPTGTVISQSPGNGSTAIKTSAVNLVVSNGLPTTPVPNVIGLEQSIAESHIVAEGLVVGNVTTETSTTVSPGDVIRQSPNSGSLLVFGGSVNLVVAGNSPPVANNGSATVDEDGSVAITPTATDSDAGASLTYSVVSGPANGALSGTAPNLTYTPNANFNGSDSFAFKANDGTVDSNVASISITVNAVNDTPVWTGNPIVGSDATKDVPYSGALAGEASDVDTSDSLTFALVGAQGWLSVAPDGTLSGTPTSTDVGPNTFTVSVTDGVIGTPVQTTLDITVNPPTGANLLAYEGFDYPVGELLGLNGGQGFASGWADSGGTSTQGYVRDETTNVFFDNTTLNWDGVLNNGFPTSPGTGSRYMASDAQIGSNVDVKRTLAASAGAMAGADGVLWMSAVYRFPNGNSGAGINFGFTDGGHLTDRGRRTSSTTMDFIGVSGWNGTSAWSQQLNPTIIDSTTATNYIWNQFARTAGGVNMSSTVDKIIVLKFSFGASDKVEAFWFDENTALASMTEEAFNAGKIGATYAAGINENNLNTLVYSQGRFDNAIDEIRIGDSFAVVAGQDAPQNTAPTWATNPVNEADANEDAAYSATLAENAGDADAGDTLTFAKVSGPAWLDVAANGTLYGTPSNADVGANVFTVSVTDNNSSAVEATLNITVNPVNDAPVASNGSATTNEDTAVGITLVATDIDSTIQSYTIVTAPTKGTLSGTAPNLTYTPNANANGADSFNFKANDGTVDSNIATVSITVTAVNDVPVATDGSATTNEDTAVGITLVATDVESAATYSVVSGPANGVLSGTAPNLTYTPNANANGSDSFNFKANDGTVDSNIATVSITVGSVNDAPVFTADPIVAVGGSEGVAYTGVTLAGSATDADSGDTITYSKVSGPAWLTVASDGALAGTPSAGSAGLNAFVVRATDTGSATADATLEITVTGLPLPWLSTDIGTGMLAGSATHSAGTFTQAGSGLIAGTSDKFRFTYQTITGDGEIIARISSLQNTGTAARVGVMIRETLASNSKQIFMGMAGNSGYRWMRRSSNGGSPSTSNNGSGTVPNTWVRVVRTGSTIASYKSSNGTSWTLVNSSTNTTFASTCYIGLAVGSGSDTTLNTSQFGNVSVTP